MRSFYKINFLLALALFTFIMKGVCFAQLENVTKFGYQLQNINIKDISNSEFDIFVMDYSDDGSNETRFSKKQIDSIKNKGKLAISYLSIGEAESYRFYWKDSWDANGDGKPDNGAPAWLDVENPDWPGNYKVHYWDNIWKQIIYSYIDDIIGAGFDGIYLDIIDGYYYYLDKGRTNAADEMIDFVADIADYARSKSPGFIIIPQNGAFIIYDAVDMSKYDLYLSAIDGIGCEDTYFYGDRPEDNEYLPDDELIILLSIDYQMSGKAVFIIDYLTDPDKKETLCTECAINDFLPCATVRNLDVLPTYPCSGNSVASNNKPEQQEILNFPNPFNNSTNIEFVSDNQSSAELAIYDATGRLIFRSKESLSAGHNIVTWNGADFFGKDVNNGMYFFRLRYGDVTKSGSMLLYK